MAEFGDTDLLLALINFCKIHPPKYKKLKNQMHSQSEDAILRLVNMGNDLKQTPLMFAAYHGRDDVIAFLLKQVSRRVKYIELNGINQSSSSYVLRALILGPLTVVGEELRFTTPA